MKNQIKNIALWIIPVFTTVCSVIYINLAVQGSKHNIASRDIVSDQIIVNSLILEDKKSVTHFE